MVCATYQYTLAAPAAHVPMTRLTFSLLPFAACLGLWACPGQPRDPPCANQEGPTVTVDGGVRCDEPFSLEASEGVPTRFAVKVVQYMHMSSAGLVETDTIGGAIGWADFVVEPGATSGRMDLKLCHLEVPKIEIPGQPQASSLELVPGALAYVPPAPTGFDLEGLATCDGFVTEPSVVLVAARLVDDLWDPLPSDASTQTCPSELATGCLFDQDEDGKPAVTFIARNFPALAVDEIYATLRSWVSLDGLVARPDLLLGTAFFGLEISVVGCRLSPMGGGDLRDCTPEEEDVIARITPSITQNPDLDSTFLAVRVTPDTGCPEVIERADQLFGR